MGITAFDIELLDKVIDRFSTKNVIEAGAQNLYNQPLLPAPYAHEYYEPKGVQYSCIDLSKENKCIVMDLSLPHDISQQYQLVTNFGTAEHIGDNGKFSWEAAYNFFNTMHKLLEVGGIVIHENPKDGHWENHGFFYFTEDFYRQLVLLCNYEIIELGTVCAMGNCETGQNIYAVMQKHSELFPTLEQFKTLPLKSREQQIPENTLTCGIEHKIGNEYYNITKTELDGKTCNCGKFKFIAEMCGCVEKKLELKAYENN